MDDRSDPIFGDLGPPGTIKVHDPKHLGSSYNVLVNCNDGTQTWKPLTLMANEDPVTLVCYAHDNDLLISPEWKFLRELLSVNNL